MKKSKRKRSRAEKARLHRIKKHKQKEKIQELHRRLEITKNQLVKQLELESLKTPRRSEKPVKKAPKLTLFERQRIYLLADQGHGVNKIARDIGRDRSTVSRELKRNKPLERVLWLDPYSRAKQAHDLAKERKSKGRRGRTRLKSFALQRLVHFYIKELGYSPEVISGRLFLELGISLSHEAIYQWIYEVQTDLIPFLYRQGRRYRRNSKQRSRSKPTPAAPKRSIEERSEDANNREELGHWEVDTIVSKQSKSCLLVLVERATRYFFVCKLPSCTVDEASSAVIRLLQGVNKEYVKSLTCDNGCENWGHDRIEAVLGIPVYFCHPYTSSERGTVENRNGIVRRTFPKKTNFELVTEAQIESARDAIVNRPMKCLEYFTPHEVFNNEYKPIFKLAA